MNRLILAVYGTAYAALGVLLMPGDWRLLAVIPPAATWAYWRLLKPYTPQHADTAGLGLTSPEPSPAGSMIYDAELDWRARSGLLPLDPRMSVYGMVSGAGEPPWPVEERWPGHDGMYLLPAPPPAAMSLINPPSPGAGMVAGETPAQGMGDLTETPAPDAGPGALVSSWAPGPAAPEIAHQEDWEAAALPPDPAGMPRVWVAADVAAYIRTQDADVRAFLAGLANDVATYRMRFAL